MENGKWKTVKAVVFSTLIAFGVLGLWQTASAENEDVPGFNPGGDLPTIILPPVKTLPNPRFTYSACPPRAVRHWDKIIFSLGRLDAHESGQTDSQHADVLHFAKLLRIRPHSPLDIKVLDDPKEVADLREKVAIFLSRRMKHNSEAGIGEINRDTVEQLVKLIYVHDVDYAFICSALPHPEPTLPPLPTPTPTPTAPAGNQSPAFPQPTRTGVTTQNQYNNLGQLIGAVTSLEILTPAVDPDGDPLTYAWTAPNGSIISNGGPTATWTRVIQWGQPALGTVRATVSDGRGGMAIFTFTFN